MRGQNHRAAIISERAIHPSTRRTWRCEEWCILPGYVAFGEGFPLSLSSAPIEELSLSGWLGGGCSKQRGLIVLWPQTSCELNSTTAFESIYNMCEIVCTALKLCRIIMFVGRFAQQAGSEYVEHTRLTFYRLREKEKERLRRKKMCNFVMYDSVSAYFPTVR